MIVVIDFQVQPYDYANSHPCLDFFVFGSPEESAWNQQRSNAPYDPRRESNDPRRESDDTHRRVLNEYQWIRDNMHGHLLHYIAQGISHLNREQGLPWIRLNP